MTGTIEAWTGGRTLRHLPRPVKALLSAFLLSTFLGVLLGSGFVKHTTRLLPEGIAERYLGTERLGIDPEQLSPDREIQYEKSVSDLYNITHTHILSLSVIFLCIGGIFLFAGVFPGWLRGLLVIEPFVSLILTFGGMWLMKFLGPGWSWLIAVSGTFMVLSLTVMTAASLAVLWRRPA